jgi:hypothetical protein
VRLTGHQAKESNMTRTKWLTIGIVLALAVVLVGARPTLAQMRGQRGQGGQGWGCGQGQGQGQGYGPGYGTCPNNNQGNQYGQGNRSNNPQANRGCRGPKGGGGGRNYPPNTQPSAPPVTP